MSIIVCISIAIILSSVSQRVSLLRLLPLENKKSGDEWKAIYWKQDKGKRRLSESLEWNLKKSNLESCLAFFPVMSRFV